MKEESIEEAAKNYAKNKTSHKTFQEIHERDFKEGAKCQQQRMYSEEDMRKAFKDGSWVTSWSDMGIEMKYDTFEQWFEQFKKK